MKSFETISYNIQFGKKFADVIGWIEQAELYPEVFCFQEFPEEKLSFFETFLAKRGYEFVYTPSIIIRGVKMGELTAHKRSDLELLGHKELLLGRYLWEKSHRAVKGQRSALLTSYRYKDEYFSVGNVHLSNFSPHSMRYKQLRKVIEELRFFSEDSLIIGDFNYTSLFGVKRLFKFMDTFGFSCIDKRLITHKIFNHIPQQLDYIFYKGFNPQEIAVHKVPHSDHLPLAVKLAWAY